jgi:hypothetical protein
MFNDSLASYRIIAQTMESTMPDSLIEVWRRLIAGPQKSWVLFKHGTCVILMQPEADLAAQATGIMQQWGPVHAGSSAGDFSILTLSAYPGWVVTGHHRDMLNYVSPDEVAEPEPSDLIIGLIGHSKRDQDGADPQVIHVEDKRGGG